MKFNLLLFIIFIFMNYTFTSCKSDNSAKNKNINISKTETETIKDSINLNLELDSEETDSNNFLPHFKNNPKSYYDLGKNENVYFISATERENLGINIIYHIQISKEEEFAMNGNANIEKITFEQNSFTIVDSPLNLPINNVYNLKKTINQFQFLNGYFLNFKNNHLIESGGMGYASYYYKTFNYFGDSTALISSSPAGHASGSQPSTFYKNVYNQNQDLIYQISYGPICSADYTEENKDSLQEIELEYSFQESINEFNKYRIEKLFDVKNEVRYDTSYFNKKNNLTQILKYDYNFNAFDKLIINQLYIGDVKIEKFIKNKIGYLPKILLIEIYKYGVCTFYLNKINNKYYGGSFECLEDIQ